MATKVMKYTDDLGEVWGVNVDDTAQSIMAELDQDGGSFDASSTGQKVFLYDDFEAFEAAYADKEMLPATITPRRVTLSHPMGTRELVAPTKFDLEELQQPLLQTGLGDDQITITRLQGEVNNAPDIDEPT